jgi:hypothetical protein
LAGLPHPTHACINKFAEARGSGGGSTLKTLQGFILILIDLSILGQADHAENLLKML